MELKVRAIDGIEQKSVQEVENELLEKHEQEVNSEVDGSAEQVNSEVDNDKVSAETAPTTETQASELSEDDVLSFIKKKYDKEITSVQDLFQAREESESLPEDVATYLKYKKETGRGFEDFSKLNRDLDTVNPDKLLKEYLMATEKGLDEEDIDALMEDYAYDEELDDDTAVKKIRLKKKKDIAKAKEYFESEKENTEFLLSQAGVLFLMKTKKL